MSTIRSTDSTHGKLNAIRHTPPHWQFDFSDRSPRRRNIAVTVILVAAVIVLGIARWVMA